MLQEGRGEVVDAALTAPGSVRQIGVIGEQQQLHRASSAQA